MKEYPRGSGTGSHPSRRAVGIWHGTVLRLLQDNLSGGDGAVNWMALFIVDHSQKMLGSILIMI